MKTLIKKFTLELLLMHLSILAFSQTEYYYDYTTLSNSQCNVFYPAKIINSRSHTSTCGQPTYNNINHSIVLDSKILSSSLTYGTEFKIEFPFKQAYSYVIRVNAWAIRSQSSDPYPSLHVDFASTSSGSGIYCSGPEPINYTGNQSQPVNIGSGFENYEFSFSLLSAAKNFIYISNLPPVNTIYSSIEIRKITIIETPPPPTFNIAPSSVNITCGTTTPTTFTINNVYNISGVSAYTWNLGATPNGWLLPNGSPAPASYSTGLNNTITLTPACGLAQKNVSASVTVYGSNYNSINSSIISIAQPSLSITGNSSLCSGSTNYSIAGLPCNSSIVWNAPSTNYGTLSNLNSSPTTLTTGTSSGNITLIANVTSCGTTLQVTKPVHIGPYTSSDFNLNVDGAINGYLQWCPNKTYSFYVNSGTLGATGSNYLWTIPTGWTQNYISNYLCVLNSPNTTSPPTGSINVSFTEGCGTTVNKSMFLAYSSTACNYTNPCFQYSPNPASSYLNISVASGCIGSTYIRKIELVRASTGTSVYYQDYTYGSVTSTTIVMSSYPTGIYYLKIFDGTNWSTYSISH
ncbi:MAG: hypothetical protein IT254_06145 [Chitinophagaceae bacterium]|nr:hypothetical protein [Chitinophagaceae bacterium]